MVVGMGIELTKGKENLFVYPLLEVFNQTNLTIHKVFSVASLFLYVFFVINMAFNCIKLWVGTIEVKKLAIDAMYKLVIVTLLWSCYFPLRNLCLTMGTKLGTELSGGYDGLMLEYSTLLTDAENKIKNAVKKYEQVLKHAATATVQNPGQIPALLEDSLGDYCIASGLTKEQAVEKMQSLGITVVRGDGNDDAGDKGFSLLADSDFITAMKNYNEKQKEQRKNYIKKNKEMTKEEKKKELAKLNYEIDYTDDYHIRNTLSTIKAYSDLMNVSGSMGIPTEAEIGQKFTKYCYNLNLDVKEQSINTSKHTSSPVGSLDKKIGEILNPIALIKAVELNSKVVEFKHRNAERSFVVNSGIPMADESENTTISELNANSFFEKLVNQIFAFINDKLLYITVIILVVQYIVTIIEYLFITSIGIVFVPMLYFDGTKQYGTKLVSLWINYLFKFFFICFVIMFEFNLCLHTSIMLVNQQDAFANQLGAIGAVFFNFILSMTLANSPEKLANSLLSGQPSLSVGDMAHAAHSAAGMARTGKNIVSGAKSVGQAGGRMVGNEITKRAAGIAAAQQFYKSHKDDEKYQSKHGGMKMAGDMVGKYFGTNAKVAAAQTAGNVVGALTGTKGTRSAFGIKGKDDKGNVGNVYSAGLGTGMGGHGGGDFSTQLRGMKNLGQSIARADDKERMSKSPKSNE